MIQKRLNQIASIHCVSFQNGCAYFHFDRSCFSNSSDCIHHLLNANCAYTDFLSDCET